MGDGSHKILDKRQKIKYKRQKRGAYIAGLLIFESSIISCPFQLFNISHLLSINYFLFIISFFEQNERIK